MIYSILDNDLYKFTVSYAYMKKFPDAECTFTFKDRNHIKRTPEFLKKFKKLLKEICNNTKLTIEELNWLLTAHKVDFIAPYYWEWLYSFRFEYDKIKVYLDEDGVLCMEVTDKCYKASLYEIPFTKRFSCGKITIDRILNSSGEGDKPHGPEYEHPPISGTVENSISEQSVSWHYASRFRDCSHPVRIYHLLVRE